VDAEAGIGLQAPDHPVAVDFDAIRSISVPFAEELLVPLLAGRLAGFTKSIRS
jgi:hypothetical protein